MSLLQPHSSPDKTADYTTCSGKRIVCGVCVCMHICMCVSPDPKRSSANRTFTSQECTFSDKHIFTHQSPPSRRNLSRSHSLARLHTLTKSHPWSHFLDTHAHTLNQVWLSERATQWEWVIRPSESRPDLSLHIKSSMRMCVFMSQWL